MLEVMNLICLQIRFFGLPGLAADSPGCVRRRIEDPEGAICTLRAVVELLGNSRALFLRIWRSIRPIHRNKVPQFPFGAKRAYFAEIVPCSSPQPSHSLGSALPPTCRAARGGTSLRSCRLVKWPRVNCIDLSGTSR